MNKSWTIRRTTNSDIQAIFSLLCTSWLETYVNEDMGITREFLLNIKIEQFTYNFYKNDCKYDHFTNTKDNLHLVAVDQNDIVIGFLHCRRNKGEQELGGLYLFSEFKGTGLAQEFSDEFLEWEDTSFNTTLGVLKYNARAIKFYEKLGFVPNGVEYTINEKIPCIDMIKKNLKEK